MAASPPEAGLVRRDRLVGLALAGLTLATVVVGGLGAPARPPAPVVRAEDDPGCQEWSNGCFVCRRLPTGDACSLPGIACTPGPTRCLGRDAEP